MEVAYETEDLRDVFDFPARAVARYGENVARALAVRFADIRALANAAELGIFSPDFRSIGGLPALELDLAEGVRLVLVANDRKNRGKSGVDWASVKRVRVFEIVRTNAQV